MYSATIGLSGLGATRGDATHDSTPEPVPHGAGRGLGGLEEATARRHRHAYFIF